MVDVDVLHVRRQLVAQAPPAQVSGAHELDGESRYGVVLIVVMRDERRRLLPHGLVVPVQLAEAAPAVFVHPLAFGDERIVAFDRRLDEPLMYRIP